MLPVVTKRADRLAVAAAFSVLAGLTTGCSGPSFGESLDTVIGIHDDTVEILDVPPESTLTRASQNIGPGGCYDGGCPSGRWEYTDWVGYDPSLCDEWAYAFTEAGWTVTRVRNTIAPLGLDSESLCQVEASLGEREVEVNLALSDGELYVRIDASWRVR